MAFQRPNKATIFILFLACVAVQIGTTVLFGTSAGIMVTGALIALCTALVAHAYFTLAARLTEHRHLATSEHVTTTRQVQSLLYIYSVLKLRRPLPPMRDMAISPDFAATLVSLVLEQRPKVILEFGSGTSTLLCGYCLEQLGGGKIISIDHDGKYAEQTRASLRAHGVDGFAEVIHAPIQDVTVSAGSWKWYDTGFLSALPQVDLMIVDGPPAWLQKLARYPALPIIANHLSPSAVVLVDDADRGDETSMVEKWLLEFPGFMRSSLLHEKGTVLLRRTAAGVGVHSVSENGTSV
jgi:predicted O-methyltransferase YrrM